MDWLEPKTAFTIFHLLAVALGAGGAYMSDLMFFSSARDERFSPTEMRFMRLGGKTVWAGLALLYISGALLFSLDPIGYADSAKFLAKISIVVVITMNGLLFHISHIPRLERHLNSHYPSSDEFMRKLPFLAAGGAISFVSWTCAIILGSMRSVPYTYGEIMYTYAGILVVAIVVAIIGARIRFRAGGRARRSR